MINQDEFIVVLPSNVPSSTQNTPSKYLTTFDSPFQLEGDWQVALQEISFKNTIKTINNDYASAYIKKKVASKQIKTLPLNPTATLKKHTWGVAIARASLKDSEGFKTWMVLKTSNEMITCSYKNEKIFHIGFNPNKNQFFINNETKYKLTIQFNSFTASSMGLIDSYPITLLYANDLVEIKNVSPGKNYYTFGHYAVDDLLPIEPVKKDAKLNGFHCNITFYDYDDVYEIKSVPKSGSYISGNSLEKELNKNPDFIKFFKFIYNEHLNRFEIEVKNKELSVRLCLMNGLNDVLGFSKSEFDNFNNAYITADMQLNLLRGISSIFIYCDLCEQVRVGNTLSPLLRNVAFNPSRYGEMINVTYNNLIYIPLIKSFIDKIMIHLCDASGETIPFIEGLTTCILHFKRL